MVVAVIRIAFAGAKAKGDRGMQSHSFRPSHSCRKQVHSRERTRARPLGMCVGGARGGGTSAGGAQAQ